MNFGNFTKNKNKVMRHKISTSYLCKTEVEDEGFYQKYL